MKLRILSFSVVFIALVGVALADTIVDNAATSTYIKTGNEQDNKTNLSIRATNMTNVTSWLVSYTSASTKNITAQRCGTNQTDLFICLKADETSGTLVEDSKSKANFTFQGETSLTSKPGKINGSINLDGNDDRITRVINITPPFAFSFWFESTNASSQEVIHAGDEWGDASFFFVRLNNGGIRFGVWNTAPALISTGYNYTYNDGNKHNVVGIFNNTHVLIYIDGILKDTKAFSGTPRRLDDTFTIGRRYSSNTGGAASSNYFNGSVDEFRLYNRTLNSSEVLENYRSKAEQIRVRSNVNTTYSGTTNPAIIPFIAGELPTILISSLNSSITQDGHTINNYDNGTNFTLTSTITVAEDVHIISDTADGDYQVVNVSYVPSETWNTTWINISVTDNSAEYNDSVTLLSNDGNAVVYKNYPKFNISTVNLTGNTTYYYNLTLKNLTVPVDTATILYGVAKNWYTITGGERNNRTNFSLGRTINATNITSWLISFTSVSSKSISTQRCGVNQTDLFICMYMDETSGTNLNEVNKNLDFTFQGESSLSSKPGRINTGINFDGSDDRAFRTLNLTVPFSIGFSFKATNASSQEVVNIGDEFGDKKFLAFRLNNGGIRFLAFDTPTTAKNTGYNYSYNDGNFHDVEGQINGTHLILYIDGVLKDTTPYSTLNRQDDTFTIGRRYLSNGASSNYLNATFDELWAYNRTRNASEVLEHHMYRAEQIQARTDANATTGLTSVPYLAGESPTLLQFFANSSLTQDGYTIGNYDNGTNFTLSTTIITAEDVRKTWDGIDADYQTVNMSYTPSAFYNITWINATVTNNGYGYGNSLTMVSSDPGATAYNNYPNINISTTNLSGETEYFYNLTYFNNTPPATTVADQSFHYTQEVVILSSVSDPDGDPVTCYAKFNGIEQTPCASNDYGTASTGVYTFYLNATDGKVWTNTTATISVYVKAKGYIYNEGSTTIEGARVFLTYSNGSQVNVTNSTATGYYELPVTNVTGSHYVFAKRTDESSNKTATFTTGSADTWQNITLIRQYNATTNSNIYVNMSGSFELDGDTVLYSTNRSDLFTDFDISTGKGNWSTPDIGTYYIRFGASDDTGYSNKTLLFTVTQGAQSIPPVPVNLTNTTGNFWINHTWEAGSGNVTDGYNVSINNVWYNGTALHNYTASTAHGHANITVWAYNRTGGGVLSSTSVSQNTQVPNNAPTLSNTTNQTVNVGTVIYIDINCSDLDSDTCTIGNNRTDLFTDYNSDLGIGNWNTAGDAAGTYYVNINGTDIYGGITNYVMTFTLNETLNFIAPNPINIAGSSGNFWINQTWQAGSGNITNSYNVSFNNGSWYNGSVKPYSNNTLAAHAHQNTTVWAYNNTQGNLSSGSVSLNTTIANNAITISNISTSYTKSAGTTLYIDANYADADSDTGTFATTATKGTFNTTTGVLTWTTTTGDAGMYNWAINVTDGYGSVSTQAFSVEVSTAGIPAIRKYNQTYTGDGTLYKPVTSGSTVQFNILETSGVFDTYNWQVDGVTVSNNLPNYSRVFTHGASGNNHRIVAWISGDLGNSNSIEWRMPVMAAMATTPVATLNETAYDNVETAVRSYDFISFMGAVVGGYTDVVGNVFYLLLWLAIFGAYWLRQKSVTIPVTIMLIMGGALIAMLPEEYQTYAIAIIGFGGFSLLYLVFTERRA